MINRVVNYGCSHAFGAEIYEPGDNFHPKNILLNFGNLVAEHLGVDFKIAARPGNSNKQIMHDVIQFTQPGDLCLLSWTYGDRDRFISPENKSIDGNVNYTTYHTLSVLSKKKYKDSYKSFLERFIPNSDQKRREKIESSHYFIQNADDDLIYNFCKAQYEYYSNLDIQTFNFLEIYNNANEIVKSRGAIPINFHYDMEPELLINLKFPEEMNTKYFHAKSAYANFSNELSEEYLDYFLIHNDNFKISTLYSYYKNDKSRITWVKSPGKNPQPYSFKHWYCDTFFKNPFVWPNGRLGHLDAHGHRVLSKLIIKKLEEINAN